MSRVTSSLNHYDIAIIGGGMVGAALACGLQQTDLRIILIDAAPLPAPPDHRLIALNHSSCTALQSLGIWDALADKAAPILKIHVTQRGKFGSVLLSAQEAGLTQFGAVVPAAAIQHALYAQLAQAEILHARVSGIQETTENVVLTTENATLTARCVIAADGTHSTVRKLLNIPTETIDYQQQALVTVTSLKQAHDGVARERFHATGALAMLPLQGNQAATIWSDTTAHIDALMQLSDKDFVARLQQQMGHYAGKLLDVAQRYTYPLTFMHVKPQQQVRQRIALIGNAAHTLHPIAAQGLNLALHEILFFVNYFAHRGAASLNLPQHPDYFAQQKTALQLSHRLNQLFCSDILPLSMLRGVGMSLLDICASAKQHFIARALGQNL